VYFYSRIPKPFQRRLARWLGRRPCRIDLATPIIAFTFDDFPQSALFNAGAILREHGFIGTYYASFGLMGRTIPSGEIFTPADLPEFARQQHELGCHTFDHCDPWDTAPFEFEASTLRNQRWVAKEFPGLTMRTLSYPISYPRPQTKRRVARHFQCARGGGQTFNTGIADLNYLKSFFIEQSRDNLDAIKQTIDANARARGWLIFSTHDVCNSPTRYGCTPKVFKEVVRFAAYSGAEILPVYAALRQIRGSVERVETPLPFYQSRNTIRAFVELGRDVPTAPFFAI
jgi:peptidoglycan/xylan/chitin deacetylase (PgdA/CDA1 family)